MQFLQEYVKSPGVSGSLGYTEADSAESALAYLMTQIPGCQEYCVFTVDRARLVSEDMPPGIHWSKTSEAIALLGTKISLPEHFLAWTQELGYIRHTQRQEAVKELRRQVREWVTTFRGHYRTAS